MIAPMMGLVFWIGLLWRPMTVAGAWTTTLTGFALWWITTQPVFIGWLARIPSADALRLVWAEAGKTEVYLPWQILFYMTSATMAGIFVSLLTKRVSDEKLDRFYALSRTPVVPGEEILQPCVLPISTEVSQRKMLTTSMGLEIPRPSRTSIVGFFISCLLVVAMVAGFAWIVS